MPDAASPANLLSILRAPTATPEPAPDLPGGKFSPAQATRWIAWRNAAIQRATVPPNVKQAMQGAEDFGEGEIIPSQTQAQRNLMETEARSRAGARPGTPSITGVPPQPGRDIPLEYGLHPDASGGVVSRPGVQPIVSRSFSQPGTGMTLAPGDQPEMSAPDNEDFRIGTTADIRQRATERGMEVKPPGPGDHMPIASGNMSDLAAQPGGGNVSALLNTLRAQPSLQPVLAQLTGQMPASLQPPTRTLPGPGFIPGTAYLNSAIAPQVPVGAPRPLAPGEMIHNPDGSWSSEVSMTVSGDKSLNDGNATIIPSLWIKNGFPYVAKDEDEAIQLAKDSGLQWPSYPSLDAAEAASKAREAIWQTVGTHNAHTISPLWTVPGATMEPVADAYKDYIEPPGKGQ